MASANVTSTLSFDSCSMNNNVNYINTDFDTLAHNFQLYHKNPINVLLHVLTSPLGVIGVFSLIRYFANSSSAVVAITFFYCMSLLTVVPNGVFAGTVFLCVSLVLICRHLKFDIKSSIALIIAGYILQDMAHLATGEETYQSKYSKGGHISFTNNWLENFIEHVYYLLPLVVHISMPYLNTKIPSDYEAILNSPIPDKMQQIDAFKWFLSPLIILAVGSYCLDSKNGFCCFPGMPYFHRVLRCNLVTGDEDCKKDSLKIIRDWVMEHKPAEDKSSHWWYNDLSGKEKEAYDSCVNSKQIYSIFRNLFSEKNYCMEKIEGMNEIYVTGPERNKEVANSDQVFYTRHVDGPYGLIPFVSVYRCIVGMDKNHLITTHFPLANCSVNACEGDVLAFDFNREVHFITCDDSKKSVSDDFRVVLKLHYCIYPRVLAPLGWIMSYLNTGYNMAFRALFLKTINPKTMYEHFLAWNVNFNTVLFDRIETYLGQRSVIYIIFVASLAWSTNSYEIFFILTSFVHYIRYISTFYIRKGIDFGSFKRDVLLFKTLAIAQLAYHYILPTKEAFQFDFISIIMIASGYIVSMLATAALGIDRTYFAAELGLVEPKWITQFPYGYIPHPMIVSQIWALLGFYKANHFRAECPYVIPVHIALYVIHALQEHFNIYKRYDDDKVKIL